MSKFFKKSKIPYFGPFWAFFAQIWAKINFNGKKGSVSLSISNYLLPYKKSGKTNEQFLRKMPNWWTERWTDGSGFLGTFDLNFIDFGFCFNVHLQDSKSFYKQPDPTRTCNLNYFLLINCFKIVWQLLTKASKRKKSN